MSSLGQIFVEVMNVENVHPMIIHFPIVLLFVFLSFYTVTVFSPKSISQWINLGLVAILIIFSFISKSTGEDAGIEVGPTLVNPRALTNHATNALNFIWAICIMGGLFVITEIIVEKKKLLSGKPLQGLRILVLASGIFSTAMLVKTGHTGADLVYKYAAGVDIPLRRAEKVIEQHRENNQSNTDQE